MRWRLGGGSSTSDSAPPSSWFSSSAWLRVSHTTRCAAEGVARRCRRRGVLSISFALVAAGGLEPKLTRERDASLAGSAVWIACAKARPAFLSNPSTNRCLELDAWCEELKVIGDFRGVQHSQCPNPVHKSRAAFKAQVQGDAQKQTLSKEHGVRLILVPHSVSSE